MEWTEEHDLQFLIEMRASHVFSFKKKGSPERGRIWEKITDTLNSEKNLKFRIKDKRGVRDGWNLLQGKFKRKRREEGGRGLAVDEPSQKDILIEELCELEDTALYSATVKNHDKKEAEDTRQKAKERLGETKKRKKEGDGVGELK